MDEIQNLNNVTNDYESQIIKQNSYFLVFAGFIFLLLILFYLRIRSDADTMEGFTQKQNELIDALNHQNKQLDDFAHLTSHNIRSPAVNIFSLISLIDEKSTIEDYKFIFEKLSLKWTNFFQNGYLRNYINTILLFVVFFFDIPKKWCDLRFKISEQLCFSDILQISPWDCFY